MRWQVLALIAGLYALSFFLPAYWMHISWDHGPNDRGWISGQRQSGWECVRVAWNLNYPCWYANPVFWVGCVLLGMRQWLWASLLAGVALALGLAAWHPSHSPVT